MEELIGLNIPHPYLDHGIDKSKHIKNTEAMMVIGLL